MKITPSNIHKILYKMSNPFPCALCHKEIRALLNRSDRVTKAAVQVLYVNYSTGDSREETLKELKKSVSSIKTKKLLDFLLIHINKLEQLHTGESPKWENGNTVAVLIGYPNPSSRNFAPSLTNFATEQGYKFFVDSNTNACSLIQTSTRQDLLCFYSNLGWHILHEGLHYNPRNHFVFLEQLLLGPDGILTLLKAFVDKREKHQKQYLAELAEKALQAELTSYCADCGTSPCKKLDPYCPKCNSRHCWCGR